MARILIVDDETPIRKTLREILEYEKHSVEEATDGEAALKKIKAEEFDVVLCDIKMPKLDGMELLKKLEEEGLEVPIIMISAHGTIETAVEATKKGAYDFITKPPDLNRLLIALRNALDKKSLVTETKSLKKKVGKFSEIIGNSEQIQNILKTVDKVAGTDARVFITGPNGAGKELIAKRLHEKSQRANMPLIEVNCAAIPSELIESELFGYEKGSFTSAIKQRIGRFEQASGGTLFLDEIGDMSLSAQAKVLRALQENRITRVGGEKEIQVDVRIIAATNKNLKKEIEAGNFREDLFHRLYVIPIEVPALKDRPEDIPLLVKHFLTLIAQEHGSPEKGVEPKAMEYLTQLPWTGNIRELRNVIERLMIMSDKKITLEDVKKYVPQG
jgi:two-component system nitrogen regulation response regulator NtrX